MLSIACAIKTSALLNGEAFLIAGNGEESALKRDYKGPIFLQ